MKFEIKNRFTGDVQFTAEIEADQNTPWFIKVGLAVKWGYSNDAVLLGAVLSGAVLSGADLRGAVLSDAVLSDAVLSGADLRGADLRGAVLRDADLRGADLNGAGLSGADLSGAGLSGADLRGADLRDAGLSGAVLRDAVLRSFKADFWMTLTQYRNEIPALISALRDGRVDGSTYSGECACLVGTIANAKRVNVYTLDRDSGHPAEQWFLMIRKGDKPGDDTGGGFAAKMALEWAMEFCALAGIEIPASGLETDKDFNMRVEG